ncbi:MAG TPA: diacylglycerol kinase family protein [Trebonia sp.]
MPGVAFVINRAVMRDGGRMLALCREAAERHRWRAVYMVTEKAEAGTTAAHGAALDGVDLVVSVGGDGTARACAEGLAETSVPLGIVPRGTANLLARSLHIPRQPQAALDAALDSASTDRVIDLAFADEMPFTAMAGMGLDAAVVAGARLKHRLGWISYAVSGAVHIAGRPTRFTIRLDDGEPFERTARSVVAGNSGLLPGGFRLLPDARLDDGLLDVGVLAPHGPFGWSRLATRVLTRSPRQDRMLERFQARKVEITAAAPVLREVDGEVVPGGRTLTVTIRPGALTMRIPCTPAHE